MYPITAIIPTRYENPYLKPILETLEQDSVSKILLLDNGLSEQEKSNYWKFPKLSIIPCHGLSIYNMWNIGIDLAIEAFGTDSYTAVLNDDIALYPDTMRYLAEALEKDDLLTAVSPDYSRRINGGLGDLQVQYVTSTFGHNGLGCFAFMIKNNWNIRLDELFGWWYGDDDMVKQILASGKKVGKLLGLPVEHNQGTSYLHRSEELNEQISRDRVYFNSKYADDQR